MENKIIQEQVNAFSELEKDLDFLRSAYMEEHKKPQKIGYFHRNGEFDGIVSADNYGIEAVKEICMFFVEIKNFQEQLEAELSAESKSIAQQQTDAAEARQHRGRIKGQIVAALNQLEKLNIDKDKLNEIRITLADLVPDNSATKSPWNGYEAYLKEGEKVSKEKLASRFGNTLMDYLIASGFGTSHRLSRKKAAKYTVKIGEIYGFKNLNETTLCSSVSKKK